MADVKVPIPEAPDRAVLIGFQTAVTEQVRSLFMARIAARAGTDPSEHAEALGQWSRALIGLGSVHRFPFVQLCDALELRPFERDVLAVVVAPHLDPSIRTLVARFHRQGFSRVDGSLLIDLLARSRPEAISARAVLSESGLLHTSGLIELQAPSLPYALTQLDQEIVPSPRLLRILDGHTGLDPRLAGSAFLLEADVWAHEGVLTSERMDQIASYVTASEKAIGGRRGVGLLLTGAQGVGKLRVARSLAGRCGISRLLVVETSTLTTDTARLGHALRGLAHEAKLVEGRLVLRGIEHHAETSRDLTTLRGLLRNMPDIVWATSDVEMRRDDAPELGRVASIAIAVSEPDYALRSAAWSWELYSRGIQFDEDQLRELVAEYPISRASIEDVTAMLAATPVRNMATLTSLAETKLPGQLARFARRGRSRARVVNLVLSEPLRDQLSELANAVQHRTAVFERWGLNDRHAVGRGIVALFNGPPGTGKTMAANALANDLGMPLFRIDTGNIVDRYVGETEKNLSRLFSEAAASRAALLFDEADSLFGKRIEAKDSVDRHANMQVNVLLNLIEDYNGFVVLTTNMKGALDTAFLRRIIFKIRFDLPDLKERIELWNYHLPNEIPRAVGVDLRALASEFDKTSGGDIKNAVLRAALATHGKRPITQQELRDSMANELRANGSVIVEGRGQSKSSLQ